MKMRSSVALINMGAFVKKGRNVSDAERGAILFWIAAGTMYIYVYDGGYQSLGSVAVTFNANTWYEVRIRMEGRTIKAKVWPLGTAETDWLLVVYITRIQLGGAEPIGPTTICLRTAVDIASKDYADIRVTPIPRTGF